MNGTESLIGRRERVEEPKAYSYAVVRVVPRVDRDEFVNAGVIVFSPERRFLEARVRLNEDRMRALWPTADLRTVRRHLHAIPRICAGEAEAGPIARLTQTERFHWLTAPRSTVVQISPVRTGLTAEPGGVLERLLGEYVS